VAIDKSIFNHPRKDNPSKDPGLYDWRRPAYKKDDVSQLNKLLKGFPKAKRNSFILPFRFKAFFNGSSNSRKQRVTFKLSYSHSLRAHKKYIETYMPQKNKDEVNEKPALFGSDIDEYSAHMVGTHFKCIISPESQNVDLQLLSRKFIERLERFTGYELYWEGCIHSNTDHRHAHIAINGVDRNGKKVFIPKEMIKTSIRDILSDLTTKMVGERTYEEIQAAKAREPEAHRWTNLDKRLIQHKGKIYYPAMDSSLQKRLQFLSAIKLAQKEGYFYRMKNGWDEVLKISGRYNSYFDEYLKPNPIPLQLYKGGPITGVVEKSFTFDRDESWNDAVIIKTDKARYYVPVVQLNREDLDGKKVLIDVHTEGLSRQVKDKDIKIIKDSEMYRSR